MKGAPVWSFKDPKAPSTGALRVESIRHVTLRSIVVLPGSPAACDPAGGPGGAGRAARPAPPSRTLEPPAPTAPALRLNDFERGHRQHTPAAFLGDAPGSAGLATVAAPPAPALGRGWLPADLQSAGCRSGSGGAAPAFAVHAPPPNPSLALEAARRVVAELHAATGAGRASSGTAPGGGGGGGGGDGGGAAEWRSSLELLRPQLAALPPDDLANLARAAARLGLRPGAAWVSDLCAATRAAFGRKQCHGYTFATLLPALAALGAVPGAAWAADCLAALVAGAPAMYPRELAWSAAALPPLLLRALPRRGAAAALLAASGWAPAFFAACERHWELFKPQALVRALHASAQLACEYDIELPAGWLGQASARLVAARRAGALRPAEVTLSLQALLLLRKRRAACSAARRPANGPSDSAPGVAAASIGQSGEWTGSKRLQRSAAVADGRLTAEQQSCVVLQASLEQALAAGAAAFGPHELSASLLALAQLGSRPAWPWLRSVLAASEALLPRCSPRQLATLLSAGARLVRACPKAQPRPWDQAMLLQRDTELRARRELEAPGPPARRAAPGPRQLALRHAVPGGAVSVDAAGATSAGGGGGGGGGDAGPTYANDFAPQAAVVHWAQAFCAAAMPRLGGFSTEDLAAAAAALASLRVVPPPIWYEQLLRATRARFVPMAAGTGALDGGSAPTPNPTPADPAAAAVRIAVALAQLSLLPSPPDASVATRPSDAWLQLLYNSVAAAGGCGGRHAAPGSVVSLMWAAATLEWCPGDRWWRWAEGRLLQDLSTGAGAGGAALSRRLSIMLLQAYALAGRPPPPALATAALLSRPASAWLRARGGVLETAAVLRAAARLQQHQPQPKAAKGQQQHPPQQPELQQPGPPRAQRPAFVRSFAGDVAAESRPLLAGMRPRDLAALSAALADAGLDAWSVRGWRDAVLCAAQPALASGGAGLGAAEVEQLLWAASRLDLRPPAAWVEAALRRLQEGFHGAPPAALAKAACSLAAMGYRPSPEWVGGFLLATQRRLPDADAASLLRALCALARLDARPGARWLRPVLVALHARMRDLPPEGLARLLAALARMGVRPSQAYLSSVVAALLAADACAGARASTGAAADAAGSGDGGSPSACGHGSATVTTASGTVAGAGCGQGSMPDAFLVGALCSAAALGWRPHAGWAVRHGAGLWAATLQRMPTLSDVWLCRLLVAAAGIASAASPPAAWRAAAARELLRRAPRLPAAQLGRAVWAAGRTGLPVAAAAGSAAVERASGSGLQAAERVLLTRALELRDGWRAPNLIQFLTGAARLGLRPSQPWLAAAASSPALARLSALGGSRLSMAACALAALEFQPPSGWTDTAETLLQLKDPDGPAAAAMARWAIARLRQAEGAAAAAAGAAAAASSSSSDGCGAPGAVALHVPRVEAPT